MLYRNGKARCQHIEKKLWYQQVSQKQDNIFFYQ
uniref:Uncharacterized protein n=1 Tax=Rhizophora mucronata TaxID=61149 RepID=A0A2P2NI25_RHIMU